MTKAEFNKMVNEDIQRLIAKAQKETESERAAEHNQHAGLDPQGDVYKLAFVTAEERAEMEAFCDEHA